MSTKIDVVNGELSFVIKEGKKLKLKNKDTVKYKVEITPEGFSKKNGPFDLKKNLEIKANGPVKAGNFGIKLIPINTSSTKSKESKKPEDDQVIPRMIIKVG